MTPWVRVDRIRKAYSAFGDLPCIRWGCMYMESLQEESPSGSLQLRLWEILAGATWRTYSTLTFQIQRYSSSLGGTTFFLGGSDSPSTAIPSSCASFGSASSSSPASNSSGLLGAPRFLTAGRPFLIYRSFSVNRGPISCSTTFSGERKAYLDRTRSQ